MTQIGLRKKCYVSNWAQKIYYFETRSSHLYLQCSCDDEFNLEACIDVDDESFEIGDPDKEYTNVVVGNDYYLADGEDSSNVLSNVNADLDNDASLILSMSKCSFFLSTKFSQHEVFFKNMFPLKSMEGSAALLQGQFHSQIMVLTSMQLWSRHRSCSRWLNCYYILPEKCRSTQCV